MEIRDDAVGAGADRPDPPTPPFQGTGAS